MRVQENEFLRGAIFEVTEVRSDWRRPEWAEGSRPIRTHLLLYAPTAGGSIGVNGRSSKLEAERLHVFAPGTVVRLDRDGGRKDTLHWAAFEIFRQSESAEAFRSFEKELTFPAEGSYRMSGSRFMRLYDTLAAEDGGAPAGSRFLVQHVLYELLDDLLQRQAEALDPGDAQTGLKQSVAYMQRNYREDIRVDKLAELARLHPNYYSQLFKTTMKRSPVSYLTHLRMNKAKEMLLQTGKPIREIARDVGYGDEFYFSRRFKQTSGLAPTVYSAKGDLRIVSLSYPYTDHLVTLGLTPVAAQTHRHLELETKRLELPKHAVERWETSRQIFIDLQPDLILCKDNVLAKAREHVNDIAPIVSVPWSSKDVFEHQRVMAELLGRQQQAKSWRDRHERLAERLRGRVRRLIGSATAAICVVKESGLRMYGARNVGHVFYRSLQLAPPERIAKRMEPHPPGAGFNWIGIEPAEIAHYEADYLLVAVSNPDQERSVRRLMLTDAAWKRHPAVLGGRVAFLDWERWKVYSPYMLDRLMAEAAELLCRERAAAGTI